MTVYLDMDGVIADFFGEVERMYKVDHWKSIQHRDGIFVELRNTDFFNRIEKFPETDAIVKYVQEVSGGDWGICSSPLRGDEYNSAYWKRVWLERHGFMPEVEKCIFTSNKHKYAYNQLTRLPNILIDDKPENIKRWEEAGGEGILFQCNEDDAEEYLFAELRRML